MGRQPDSHIIDKRVRKLVYLLNEIPYIQTRVSVQNFRLYEAELSDEADASYLWKPLGTLYCEAGDTNKAIPYFKQT